jgi:hypothetical protein
MRETVKVLEPTLIISPAWQAVKAMREWLPLRDRSRIAPAPFPIKETS